MSTNLRCPLLHCPSLWVSLSSFSHTVVSFVDTVNAAAAVTCLGPTFSSATLHAKKSKMTCIAGSLQQFRVSLVISIGKSWGIVLRFAGQVTNVKAQFQAFQGLKDERLEIRVDLWSSLIHMIYLFKCDSPGHRMTIWSGLKHFLWYSLLFYINIFYWKCPGKILLWHIRFPVSRAFLCI